MRMGYWSRKFSAAMGVVCLAGCIASPPLPEFDSSRIEKVGVYVSSIGNPTHTHIGTTLFNNFAKPYEQNWRLEDDFRAVIGSALESEGMRPVNLNMIGFAQDDLLNAITVENMRWKVAKPNVLAKLEQADISAVIVVTPMEYLMVISNCSMHGCTEHFSEGYGLFSRGLFGSQNYITAFAFDITALLVQPPAEITQSPPLEDLGQHKNKARPWTHLQPADVNNIDAASWKRLHADLVEQMSEFAESITFVLAGNRRT